MSNFLMYIILVLLIIVILHMSLLCIINKQEHFENRKIEPTIVWNLPPQKCVENITVVEQVPEISEQIDMASELMKVLDDDNIYQQNQPDPINSEGLQKKSMDIEDNLEIDKFFTQQQDLPVFKAPKEWGKNQKTIMEGPNTIQSSNNRVGSRKDNVLHGGEFMTGLQGFDNLETNFDFLPKSK